MSSASVIRVGVTLAVAAGILAAPPVSAEDPDDDAVGLRHRVDRLEAQLADLQGTVAELEDPLEPKYVTVDCGGGQTVGAALAEAQGHIGPLHIRVQGMCEEVVHISRDDVALWGAEPGDGIRAPSGDRAIHLEAVRGIALYQLAIDADKGNCGMSASNASFIAMGMAVRGGSTCGMWLQEGSTATLASCVVEDGAGFGVMVTEAATVQLEDSEVRGHGWAGVFASIGGTATLYSTTVRDNDDGLAADAGGIIRVIDSVVENNRRNGVDALHNSTIVLEGGRVAGNESHGAHIGAGSVLGVFGATVEGNLAEAILVEQAAKITGNGGGGITLRDMSNGLGGWGGGGGAPINPVLITNNGGWGIYCGGADDAIKAGQNDFALGDIQFGGNTSGDTNCRGGH